MWHSNLFLTPLAYSTPLPQREAIFIRNGPSHKGIRSTTLNSRSSQRRFSLLRFTRWNFAREFAYRTHRRHECGSLGYRNAKHLAETSVVENWNGANSDSCLRYGLTCILGETWPGYAKVSFPTGKSVDYTPPAFSRNARLQSRLVTVSPFRRVTFPVARGY